MQPASHARRSTRGDRSGVIDAQRFARGERPRAGGSAPCGGGASLRDNRRMFTPAAATGDLLPAVRTVGFDRPLAWLRLGWHDLHACFGPSLLHGVIVAVGGLAILTLTLHAWLLMPGALTGFLLIGPILCTGLYELSRRHAAGERPRLRHAIDAWRRGTRPLVALGLLLFAAATAWVLVSALLFTLFVAEPLDTPLRLLHYAVAGQGGWLFSLWLVAGGLGAALVFALTVVSAPLLLDRRVGLRTALLASVRAVGDNPAPMALWALIIMLATAASMATLMIGFVFSVPIIGHATWHAYRDLLDAASLPPRGG
jgi:uncharacterized membrane protein